MIEIDGEKEGKNAPEGLEKVMRSIEDYCNTGELGDAAVELFQGIESNTDRKDMLAANRVWDTLMLTLSSIAEHSFQIAKDPNRLNSSAYEFVLRQLETIAGVCRSLTEGLVPLTRNEKLEKSHAEAEDIIRAYFLRDITLHGIKYQMIRILIRPNNYSMPLKIKHDRKPINVAETAQARMKIDLIPEDNPDNSVSIRADREDWERGYEITFDINISQASDNLMDKLSFPDQREGHHFSSSLKAEDLEVTFSQILQAFIEKLDSMLN